VYALSGFSLSALNLYVHVQALAWAPLVVATLVAASSGGRRQVTAAALATAVCLSTLGVEIAIQAALFGWVLAGSRQLASLLRLAGGTLLGFGLAAAPLLGLADLVSQSHRGAGFSIPVALEQSVHPVSLIQTVVAGLYGEPMSFGSAYWGTEYWGGGFPYFISLYLGAGVLCLVVLGAAAPQRYRTPLVLLLLAGTVVSLGSWARLDLLLEIVPWLRKFRYPVKAFFTTHLAASMLACLAAQRLLGAHRLWRTVVFAAVPAGLALLSVRFLETWFPPAFLWFQSNFFAAAYPETLRAPALRAIVADAATGSLPLFTMAGLAVLRLRGRISANAAVVSVAAVIAADLLRAGASLNPTARDLHALSPEMKQVGAGLRASGGRVLTCAVQAAPAYREAARRRVGPIGIWSSAVLRQSLTPYANLGAGVPAVGRDPTASVPPERSLAVEDEMCKATGALERLRGMGVRHLIAVQPIISSGVRLVGVVSPASIAPLSIFVHELEDSLRDPGVAVSADDVDGRGIANPLAGAIARYVVDSPEMLRVAVETPQPAYVILRRAHAVGWSARVNGDPTEVVLANRRHQAIRVPAGSSEVELRYRLPHLRLGVAGSTLGAVLVAALWLSGRPRIRTGSDVSSTPPAEGG
jgi:hypothetical protein